jgi:CRISPR system Cascade subunit CasB
MTQNSDSKTTLSDVVGRMDWAMTSGELSTGDVAELRRISPTEPYTPALWKIIFTIVPDHWTKGSEREAKETAWAIIAMGLAKNAGLHARGRALGAALVEAGFSELRFVRLLRAKGGALHEEFRRMADFLASKHVNADWTDAARLVLKQEGDAAESVRRAIARDYYRAVYARESNN